MGLNLRACELVERLLADSAIHASVEDHGSGRLVDLGLQQPGGFQAGILLSQICLAGLGEVSLVASRGGFQTGADVVVWTDHPVTACLGSQYAGWQISAGDFFALGSGPMRNLARTEKLFETLAAVSSTDCWNLPSEDNTPGVVGVIETASKPPPTVFEQIAQACHRPASQLTLLVASTSSLPGMIQVVARSVETALHQLHELNFDLSRVLRGLGIAPLPPVGGDFLTAMGRSNDAILYGSEVTLWMRGDDDSLAEIGPKLPSDSSSDYGQSFSELFDRYERDFYKLDPQLFSPALVRLINVESGRTHQFGQLAPDLCTRSFLG